jgi:hypothetical protein
MLQNRIALRSAYIVPILLIIANLMVAIQSVLLEPKAYFPGGQFYPRYNNYLIFKQSFYNLIQNINLYIHHQAVHEDLFKYSPTFALLMAPFAIFPDYIGLFLWNILNTFVLYLAINKLPFLDSKAKNYLILFLFFELVTSLQNLQSNALIAGMIVLAFISFEKQKPGLAVLLILGSAFIKVFGIVALAIGIFYPNKIKTASYTVLWGIVLALLPALFIPFSHLLQQYENWMELLRNDHSISLGLSVMGWLESWFGLLGLAYKSEIVMVGTVLLLIPFFLFRRFHSYSYRLSCLCLILIWIVIFNHRAESPTFIIAATGVGIWYFSSTNRSLLDHILIALVLVFTILSPTDLFPGSVRDRYVIPYVLKAVPCILVWFRIWQETVFNRSLEQLSIE